jgi:Cu+-exporting ATPase
MSDSTAIDYSFVTGEAVPITKQSGDKVFAGGRQMENYRNGSLHSVSQSYLTTMGNVFQKKCIRKHKTITDTVSKYFTPALLAIAFIGLVGCLLTH